MTILNEYESKQLLKEYEINIPKGEIAKIDNIMNDIFKIRNNIKSNQYVLKIVSEDIIHKSNIGGVVLNIPHDQVMFECGKMLDNIRNKLPQAKIDGIYIQEMVEPGIECIIGIKEDIQFGKVITFGMGGIFVEVYHDISMRVLPITSCDIEEMISETKIYQILKGYRGKKYDIKGIIDVIIKIIQLSEKYNIQEMDLNPIIVYQKGNIVVDARIKT